MIYIDNTHAIMFSHINISADYDLADWNPNWVSAKEHRATICEIVELDGEKIINKLAKGIARCNPLDNYNKEIGRKNSLTKALNNSNYGKVDRKRIWRAYHERWVKNK